MKTNSQDFVSESLRALATLKSSPVPTFPAAQQSSGTAGRYCFKELVAKVKDLEEAAQRDRSLKAAWSNAEIAIRPPSSAVQQCESSPPVRTLEDTQIVIDSVQHQYQKPPTPTAYSATGPVLQTFPSSQKYQLETPRNPLQAVGPLNNAFFTGGKSTPFPSVPQSKRQLTATSDDLFPGIADTPSRFSPPQVPELKIAPAQYQCAAGEWRREFEWTAKLKKLNQLVFRLGSFRENQEEVMNACLSGKDVFVCMPTGGGKSLTFQLPALLDNGLTLVVMPLISLIRDQTQYLRSLGIRISEFNSSQTASEQQEIYTELESSSDVKMLFITPEKLAQSDKLMSFLAGMNRAGRIARLVIDEAHCVSKWGRDFRTDYLKLAAFRPKFPSVPILALTATATDKVKEDVMKVLCMRNPAVFLSSFNRPNLRYTVKPKPRNPIADIAAFIAAQHHNHTGLIYCISTKDCERVAKELKTTYKMKAGYYHAKMKPEKRTKAQTKWMNDEIKVLAATVAFGMGINKANVRYVIHFSLPKSLENYYQESGRAGRDGLPADCLLFYTYNDKLRQDYLIHKSSRRDDRQHENFSELNSMIKYCEDVFTCRRKQQLAHFGEEFDAAHCAKTCDNCLAARVALPRDLTPQAILVLKIFEGNRFGLNTMNQMASLLKGGNSKALQRFQYHECFAALKHMAREDIEKLMHTLVYEDVVRERSVKTFKQNYSTSLDLGSNATNVLAGRMKIVVLYEKKQSKVTLPSGKGTPISYPPDETDERISQPEEAYLSGMALMPRLESLCYKPNPPPAQSITPFPKLQNPSAGVMTTELYNELVDRLNIVRTKLAKKAQREPREILSDELLTLLCKLLPTTRNNKVRDFAVEIPKEFMKEIDYFAEVNELDCEVEEDCVENSDSSDDEFRNPLTLKRKRESESSHSEKKSKVAL